MLLIKQKSEIRVSLVVKKRLLLKEDGGADLGCTQYFERGGGKFLERVSKKTVLF